MISNMQEILTKSDQMRPLLLVISFILFFTAANPLCSQQPALPYRDGETLTYELSYTWGGVNTDVGQGTAKMNYADGFYNPVVTGRTYKFYDIFFKVREHFESRFSDSTFRPVMFYRKSEEGKYWVENRYRFDNENGKIYANVRKRNKPEVDTVLTCTPYTFDLVSLFYNCRTMDFASLETGVKYPITFAIDKEIYNLYFIYHGKETRKIKGLGTFRTMKFSASLVAGEIFTGKDEIYIWVSDDKNIVPLLFESKVLVGTVTGRLKSWSNLKYPMTSKIK